MRQNSLDSESFIKVLERLRLCLHTESDWEYLRTNFLNNTNSLSDDTTLRLFATNEESILYNFSRLESSKEKNIGF